MIYWVNFDSARTTLHQEDCPTIRGFVAQRKTDPEYGWKWFNSRRSAIAEIGSRKYHECRRCNP